jgi:hypothetical protein
MMPKNGDINDRFGVYRSLCCNREITLGEDERFPDCPGHPKLSTIWKSVTTGSIPKASELRGFKKKDDTAA